MLYEVITISKPLSMAETLQEAKSGLEERAQTFIAHSEQAVTKIGEIGARHIRDGDVVMTHFV